jgi:hypothetical protein
MLTLPGSYAFADGSKIKQLKAINAGPTPLRRVLR